MGKKGRKLQLPEILFPKKVFFFVSPTPLLIRMRLHIFRLGGNAATHEENFFAVVEFHWRSCYTGLPLKAFSELSIQVY